MQGRLRGVRIAARFAAAALVIAGLAALVSTGSLARAAVSKRSLERRCVQALLGGGYRPARAASGSAASDVLARFSKFRDAPGGGATLPPGGLASALGVGGGRSYDPSRLVKLKAISHGAVYAVPATVGTPALPRGCASLPALVGLKGEQALLAAAVGIGPGACLIEARDHPTTSGGSQGTGTGLAAVGAQCASLAVLSSYLGALGESAAISLGPSLGADGRVLVPDGVSSITYRFSDGRRLKAMVSGNLTEIPAGTPRGKELPNRTRAALARELAIVLPTSITEAGSSASTTKTLARPRTLAGEIIDTVLLFDRVLTTLTESSSSSQASVSCSRHTHRCVEVTITTTCTSKPACRIGRTIRRYRYKGSTPPPNSSAPLNLPVAPIVGKASIALHRIKHPTLVLAGAARRRAGVVIEIDCFTKNAASGSSGPVMYLRVPSRTPIEDLPPGQGTCFANVLVTSTQPGRVKISVVASPRR